MKKIILMILFLAIIIMSLWWSFFFSMALGGPWGILLLPFFVPVILFLVYLIIKFFKEGEDEYLRKLFFTEAIMTIAFLVVAPVMGFITDFENFDTFDQGIAIILMVVIPMSILTCLTRVLIRNRNQSISL